MVEDKINFEKNKSNYLIEVSSSIFDESQKNIKKCITTKRFFYNKSFSKISDILSKIISHYEVPKTPDKNYYLTVMVRSLDNSYRITKVFPVDFPKDEIALRKIHNNIIGSLLSSKFVFDSTSFNMSLRVINHTTSSHDTKGISFNYYTDNYDKIAAVIKERMRKVQEKVLDEDSNFVFSGEKTPAKTHFIVLYHKVVVDGEKKNRSVFSFNVKCPNYSSSELVEMFKEMKNEN